MVLLEIDAEGVSGIEFKGYAPRAIDMNRITGGNETFEDIEINPGRFICSGVATTFRRSRRISIRLCSLGSIFAVRPFDHRSASILLRKVLITTQCKPCLLYTSPSPRDRT